MSMIREKVDAACDARKRMTAGTPTRRADVN
jgi:hypothetical protein